MATFAQWLLDQQSRQDGTGSLARAWLNDRTKGNVSSVAGATKHMSENWETWEQVRPLLDTAVQEFRGRTSDAIPPRPGEMPPWAQGASGGEPEEAGPPPNHPATALSPDGCPRAQWMKAQPDGITRMQQQLAAQGGISQQLTLDDVDEAPELTGQLTGQNAEIASGGLENAARALEEAGTTSIAYEGAPGVTSVSTEGAWLREPMEAPGHGVLGARGQVTDPVVIAWGLVKGEMTMLATGCILAAHPAYVQIGSRVEPGHWKIIPWHKIEAIAPARLPAAPSEEGGTPPGERRAVRERL